MKCVKVTLEFRADDLLEMALIKAALAVEGKFHGDDDLRDSIHTLVAQCVDPETNDEEVTMLQVAFESMTTERSSFVGPNGGVQ